MMHWTSSRKETYSSEMTACGSRLSVTLCTTRRHIRRGDIAPHINLELEWKWIINLKFRPFCSREWIYVMYWTEDNKDSNSCRHFEEYKYLIPTKSRTITPQISSPLIYILHCSDITASLVEQTIFNNKWNKNNNLVN